MKTILKLTIVLICNFSWGQTNLLDSSSWFEGTGSAVGFTQAGTTSENIREMGEGPHGTSELLWKTIPGTTGHDGAGGWKSDLINIDASKTYRFTVWVKKINSFDGSTIFRVVPKNSTNSIVTTTLNSNNNDYNPDFFTGNLPALDTWYLLIGYVYKSDYVGTINEGGVFDGTNGNKMINGVDFKFLADAITINQDIWLQDNENTSDAQFYYGPTMYEVNGQEPTIQDLIDGPLGTTTPNTSTESIWSLNNQDVYYNNGNVGIGTDTPESKLEVNGGIKMGLPQSRNIGDGELSISSQWGNWLTFEDNFNKDFYGFHNPNNGGRMELFIHEEATNTNKFGVFTVLKSGNIGINTASSEEKLTVNGNVNVINKMGIGVESSKIPAAFDLAVGGSIIAEEIKVQLRENGTWADYVFKKDYKLPSLKEVENHIEKNGHLLNIPSAKEVEENGILLGAMNAKLLEKIEELTLYTIQQQKEIEKQEERLEKLERFIKK